MEVEAKFSIPDESTLQRLREIDRLASFALTPGQTKHLHDTYLDTSDRRILAGGYACRRREGGGEVLMTLKSVTPADSAVHRRDEVEVTLPADLPPADWPAGPARDLLFKLAGDAPLEPLFELEQVRTVRMVQAGERLVAEMSVDEVKLENDARRLDYHDVEVELRTLGTEDDLARIAAVLHDEWGLAPELRSKFERGLALAGELRGPWPIEMLFDYYGVDRQHARAVADHALALFDALAPFHALPPERRTLLETAALVHNVGLATDPDRHHVAGRDILTEHPPAELDEQERRIVAATTYLHRKAIKEKKLKKVETDLLADDSPEVRAEALALAALLRMADGLDYSGTAGTRLGPAGVRDGSVEFEVTGPEAGADAERAQSKSDLWRWLFETDVRFLAAGTEEEQDKQDIQDTKETQDREFKKEAEDKDEGEEGEGKPEGARKARGPGVEAGDSMAEAARKILLFQFERMVEHEDGTREGEDPEELHDMRVATRRMRAALRVFDDYLKQKKIRPFARGLRRAGRALGEVRDLDVFREKTQAYLDTLPASEQGSLDPLLAAWQARRDACREDLLELLDSDDYFDFKCGFEDFLHTPGAGALPGESEDGAPRVDSVRQAAPISVYEHLATVRAAGERVSGGDAPLTDYHQLRIAFKGFRYTLEFFAEVLGPETKTLVDETKRMQDHLGALQDAVVACGVLRDFLTWGTWGHEDTKKVTLPTSPVVAPGVAAYLSARQSELQHLLDTFPEAWARIDNPDFRRAVAAAVAVL